MEPARNAVQDVRNVLSWITVLNAGVIILWLQIEAAKKIHNAHQENTQISTVPAKPAQQTALFAQLSQTALNATLPISYPPVYVKILAFQANTV